MTKRNIILAIGFDLPFSVKFLTEYAEKDLIRIQIECTNNLTEENFQRLTNHIEIFCRTGIFGMLAGKEIAPEIYNGNLEIDKFFKVAAMGHSSRLATYEIQDIKVDPNSFIILLNKLLGLSEFFVKIHFVEIHCSGPTTGNISLFLEKRDKAVYPKIYSHIPFRYEKDLYEYYETVTLTMQFLRPCKDTEVKILQYAFDIWSAQALQGGYISPPIDPGKHFLVPHEEMKFLENEIQWGIEKSWIDEGALNGLVNFLIAFHHKFNKLEELIID